MRALAAPTGRAAERMAESVRHAVQALAAAGIDADLLAALPATGTTLHRLLGTIPTRRASATTATIRCRSTWWWSTKPR